MGAMAQKVLPALPPDTAGRWLTVEPENEARIHRWLNVVHQMNHCYLVEDVDRFKQTRGHRFGKYGGTFYYWTPTFEVALRVAYLINPPQYQVISVGCLGSISVQGALDLIVEKLVEYLRGVGAKFVFAIPPKHMDDPRMQELHALVPKHPKMRVTTEHESDLATRWRVDFVDLA